MRAAVYRRFGGPEVVHVEEVPRPSFGPNDVLIRVHAATVSAADYRARSRVLPRGLWLLAPIVFGVFAPRKKILGYDAAGVIEEVGADVTAFRPGDEVITMPALHLGGHAEYLSLPQTASITAKPRNMNLVDAVTLVFGGGTMAAFFDSAPVRAGDEVLVNGASSATGTAAVQLAKYYGATVTGVTSAGNADLVGSLGADRVIDYAKEDFAVGGRGYDMVIDCIGNAPFARVEHAIKAGGVHVPVATDLKGMAAAGGQSRRTGKRILSSSVNPSSAHLAAVVAVAETGGFRPVIDSIYDLNQIAEAHRRVDTGRKKGSVVVRIAG